MKKVLLSFTILLTSISAIAQIRYHDEVYARSQVNITSDVIYGTNIDFLTSDIDSALQDLTTTAMELNTLGTNLSSGMPIPPAFFDPNDNSTIIKVTNLTLDVYEPDQATDTSTARPVIMFLHTGNFLPPPFNGAPVGNKTDSTAVELCEQWAKRGYVAISVDYRLGWNPLGSSLAERRGTLLNAVYRAIQDTKHAVRFMKQNAATYAIDPNKIVIYGQGSGGYAALAYATLDKVPEMSIPKFINPLNNASYIDTGLVGGIDGFGGQLNLFKYDNNGQNTDISMVINAGGSLADTSWLEASDVPMVSLHCVRDPFAPVDTGIVIVPTTQQNVVEVQGANVFMVKANALGNNSAYLNFPFADPYTDRARSLYGQTISYIYPAPDDQITIDANADGMFPIVRPLGNTVFQNEASPWEWWDPNSAVAQAPVGGGLTAHQASLVSNPDMSPTKGRTYIDTIQGYIHPRIMLALQLPGYQQIGVTENINIDANISVYPNPASTQMTIKIDSDNLEISSVELVSITGQVVYTQANINSSEITINRGDLSTGLYIANIKVGDSLITRKISIQ